MNKIEILPVVFQVTADAVLPVRILHLQPRVIPMLSRKRLRDFLVAIEAFKSWRAGAEGMAGCALCRASERSVRLGERSRRNLGGGAWNAEEARRGNQQRKNCPPFQHEDRMAYPLHAGRAVAHASLRFATLNYQGLAGLPVDSLHPEHQL